MMKRFCKNRLSNVAFLSLLLSNRRLGGFLKILLPIYFVETIGFQWLMKKVTFHSSLSDE